jgi:hypothetical protein
MFYSRINKIKVFNNREGFLVLFNRGAEMRIYSCASNPGTEKGRYVPALSISDDLVGYWQMTLNRAEHYPHGTRDRQDTADTTGNILVDYTLFGFENVTEG